MIHYRGSTKRVGYDVPIRNHEILWTQNWQWEMWVKMRLIEGLHRDPRCKSVPLCFSHTLTLTILASKKNRQKLRHHLLNEPSGVNKGFCWICYPSLYILTFWKTCLTANFPPVHTEVKSDTQHSPITPPRAEVSLGNWPNTAAEQIHTGKQALSFVRLDNQVPSRMLVGSEYERERIR